MTGLLVFETTHHALHAEQVALEHRFGVQVTPAPAAARAGCDLALEYLMEEESALLDALTTAHIEYRRFPDA